ncbi:hypothetical protein Y032_0010g1168 [Ancylostoma ceylanicum]|uniref:Uncharacterized protein n=1 Tax=Ancylostoma ceylanicum TaxID=53326 RepID=A0A016VI69_9BILA|nr:hypothetical protein Y032_0010g1168 [Ancylostoma ceylanicum]
MHQRWSSSQLASTEEGGKKIHAIWWRPDCERYEVTRNSKTNKTTLHRKGLNLFLKKKQNKLHDCKLYKATFRRTHPNSHD